MMSVASQYSRPYNAEFIPGTGKNQLGTGEESAGDRTLLPHCSFLRNSLPKVSGVLEHCLDEETNCFFTTFQGDSF
jgi:hypothetical protein